jgi:DNA-binding transcriptional MocR family regulator
VLDLGTSLPGQVIANLLLHDIEAVEGLLSELLPSLSWSPPRGGLIVWVRLPSGSARELAVEAQRHGVVAILPGSTTSADLSFDTHVRRTISRPPDVLAEGIRRLAVAWEDYAPRAESRRGQREVIV